MPQPQNINAIIVDDDVFCREHLSDLISNSAKNIEIAALCASGAEGIAALNKLKPQLVFLDVEMPGMDGFEMLKQIGKINFEIIFTTAHDHYAIRAIRFAAADYLLKPVRPDMLQEAVSRAQQHILNKSNSPLSPQILSELSTEKRELSKLAIPTLEGFTFLKLDDIVRCEADDRYTKIFLADKKMLLSSRNLGEFEELLHPSGFIRIHKSYLINSKHLLRYIRGEGGQVVMADGSTLDVSRRKKDELLQLVSQFK